MYILLSHLLRGCGQHKQEQVKGKERRSGTVLEGRLQWISGSRSAQENSRLMYSTMKRWNFIYTILGGTTSHIAQPSSTMWVYRTHQKEDGMPTDELIIRLFCMVDDHLGAVNKRSDAHLYP